MSEQPEPGTPAAFDLEAAQRLAFMHSETPRLRVEAIRQVLAGERFAHDQLLQVRALVDKTWPAEEHARLHPALQPASIRVAFLRILDAES